MKSRNKKVVIVTGGASGIGKNIARAFCREDSLVVICDRDKKLAQLAVEELQSISPDVTKVIVDLSVKKGCDVLIDTVYKNFGAIDVVVNNARSGKRVGYLNETESTWQETMSVTLNAPFFITQAAIRVMGDRGGVIINVSSVAAHVVGHDSPSYHIAKAGIEQMTKYFAVYAGAKHIRINCVAPGFIIKDEHMFRFNQKDNFQYKEIANFSQPLARIGTSDEIANVVTFLASSKASFITGQCIVVDGGLTIQDQSGLLYRFTTKV